MATYDIPGITTSVIDYSQTTPALPGGRTPLIAAPFKFGSEDLMILANYEDCIYKTGGANSIKYGLGMEYILGALTVTGSVLVKRLLPNDATYANIGIDNNFDSISYSEVIDGSYLKEVGYFNHLAKARGDGYNEFFVRYEAAPDLEKVYADGEGDPKYRYNFLRATIYQNSPSGIKTIKSNIPLSLIDTDPKDNVPVYDYSTGETLYINDKFSNSNDFVDAFINEDILIELKKYLTIDEVNKEKGTPEIILKDTNTGTNYKLMADKDKNLYLTSTIQEGMDRVILEYDNNGSTNYVKIYVQNGQIFKESTTDVSSSDETYTHIYFPGDLYFIDAYIDSDSGDLVLDEYKTIRSSLYQKLLSKVWILENGTDGKNLHINGIINFNGPGDVDHQNVKQLLVEFFSTNKVIKEVMYPEFDFNYVVDWTADLDVMNSIINLTDDIGNALGILCLPLSYDMESDKKARTESLYQSTYNNALYSGQWNLKHYDEYLGRRITMPLSYYMMILHLKIDSQISITEPVAGMVKAQLPVSNVKLSYNIDSYGIQTLRNLQINTIIKETDGIYCIDQLTMYKKASKLSRINVVKVIHQMRRDLPKLLKQFIQTKETSNILGKVSSTVNNYMNKWLAGGDTTNPNEIFKYANTNIIYIPEEYKLVVSIRVNPIGTIEKIDIPIIVE